MATNTRLQLIALVFLQLLFAESFQPLEAAPAINQEINQRYGGATPDKFKGRRELKEAIALKNVYELQKSGKNIEAFNKLKKLASRGNNLAIDMTGNCYLAGCGVPKNLKEALKQYTRSARRGSSHGRFMVGLSAYYGKDDNPDYKTAYSWFKSAGKYGPALYMRAWMHENGLGVDKSFIKAFDILEQGVNMNSIAAKAQAAEYYYLGRGTSKNLPLAHKYFEETASKRNPKALLYLSDMYANGVVVDKDLVKAQELFIKAGKALAQAIARTKNDLLPLPLPASELTTLSAKIKEELGDIPKVAQSSSASKEKSSNKSGPVKIQLPEIKSALKARSRNPQSKNSSNKKHTIEDLDKLATEAENLLKQYYPKIQVSKVGSTKHFEYRTRSAHNHRSNSSHIIPKLDGIICDITTNPGRYPDDLQLPKTTHENLYVSLVMAPYSIERDKHLLVKVLYTPKTPIEMLKKLKKIMKSIYVVY